MPTSNKTNQHILIVLDKHLTRITQLALFEDLSKVEGNSSFTKSIQEILKLIKTRH